MTFVSELTEAIRSGLCQYITAYNNWADFVFDDPILSTDLTRGARNSLQRFICNREPPPEPDPLVPGGQCVGVGYKWQVQFEWAGNSSDTNWLPETISNFTQPNTNGAIGELRKVGGPGGWSLRFSSGSGEVVVFSHTSGSPTGFRNFRFTQIYRADGQPDNCGNVPAPVPPPDPPVVDTDITYIDADNNSVNVPITLVYAPVTVNFNGQLSIPVRVYVDNEVNPSFSADIDIGTGDISVNFGDQNYSPTITNPPSAYDTSDVPPDVPPDVPDDYPIPDPLEPQDDTIRLLKGCIVTVTDIPPGLTEVFQEDNPNIFIPRLGNIQFAIRIGNTLSWTEEVFVKNRRQFIPCTWEGGAIDVKGTPIPGVEWVISPVYAKQAEVAEFSL